MRRRDCIFKSETLYDILASRLLGALLEDINRIRSVKDWAREAAISESSLYRIVKERFNKTPGDIIKEVRYEQIIWLMKRDSQAVAYCIALDSGFSSGDALRMFLRRCYGTNIRTLRREILSGELRMEWTWLNGNE